MNSVLKVKRFDPNLPLPAKHSDVAACFDLHSRIDTTISAHTFGQIPLNIAIEVPKNCWALLATRSSTHKLGLIPANGIGIVDEDFCGDNDEIVFLVFNVTNQDVDIERGQRIAQLMVLESKDVALKEVSSLDNSDRGGIGSTGR